MKKVIFVAIGVLMMTFAAAGVALAGNPHNGSSTLTSICAGCHRAHTAQGPRLIKLPTAFELCKTCHDGTGSNVDVKDGMLETADNSFISNGRLNGGGFVNVNGVSATAAHLDWDTDIANNTDDGSWSPWGYDVRTGQQNANPALQNTQLLGGQGLQCISCHDVHGTTMYRLLKYNPGNYNEDLAGAYPGIGVSVPPGDTYNQRPSYSYQTYDSAAFASGGPYLMHVANAANEQEKSGISAFCGACHRSYLARDDNSGTISTGATQWNGGIETYRHRIDMVWNGQDMDGPMSTVTYGTANPAVNHIAGSENIPLGHDPADDTGVLDGPTTYPQRVICLTCHFAHGTSATGTGWANPNGNANQDPNGIGWTVSNAYVTGDMSLLRMNQRGVCQSCHQRKQGNW